MPNKNKLPLALTLGIAIPIITWLWARLISPSSIIHDLPDPIMLGFSTATFLLWALLHYLLFRKPDSTSSPEHNSRALIRSTMSLCALFLLMSLSIQLQVPYWLSRSSTTALIFIFYIPYAVVALLLGAGVGWLIARLEAFLLRQAGSRLPMVLNTLLVIALIGTNIHLSHYGRFSLAPELGVKPLANTLEFTFTRRDFFSNTTVDIGAMTSIDQLRCGQDRDAMMTFTGRSGAVLATLSGEVRQSIPFDQTTGFFAYPADIDGDGMCEFIDHAGGWSPVGLYDASGHKVFSYGKKMGRARPGLIEIDYSPQDVIAFDYAGDGVRELLIPLLVVGRPTTHVVDRNGQLITSLPLDLKGCRAADLKQDGRDSLVCLRHQRKSSAFVVFDELIKERHAYPVSLEGGHHQVRLIKWPNTNGSWHAIYNSPDGLAVLDLTTGQHRVVSRIAGLSYLNTWFVKFDATRKPFVVSTQHYKDTVTIVIFTHEGDRVYQETLKRSSSAAILPQSDNTERFLIPPHVFGVRPPISRE